MQALIDCGLLDDTPRANLAPEAAPIAWVRETQNGGRAESHMADGVSQGNA